MLLPTLWWLLATPLLALGQQYTLRPINITTSAVDPILRYQPVGPRTGDTLGGYDTSNAPTGATSGASDSTWEISYTGTPNPNVTFYTIPVGESRRTTSLAGASISVKFMGTGIWFYGTTTNAGDGLEVRVDGNPTAWTGATDVLGGIVDLPYRQHTAVLTVKSGTVVVYGTNIAAAMEFQGADASTANVTEYQTTAGADKNISPWFTGSTNATGGAVWNGRWDWAGTVWDHIGAEVKDATLNFSVPANTSYLALFGGTSGWSGDYAVSFSPALETDGTGAQASQYSIWRGSDVLMWAGPLDPSIKYEMTLKTLLSAWWIDVSKVRVWSGLKEGASDGGGSGDGKTVQTGSSKKSTPIGAIVGGVVGGVAAIVLVGLAVWWFRRRRVQKSTSPLDILDRDEPDPYHPSMVQTEHKPHTAAYENQHLLNTSGHARNQSGMQSPMSEGSMEPFPFSETSSSSGALTGAQSGSGKAGFTSRREVHQQEMDAGTLVTLVPPSYDPSWSGGGSGSGSGSYPTIPDGAGHSR